MKNLTLALSLSFLSVAGVHAGTVVCAGTVTHMAYHSPNGFMIQLSSMNTPVFICNPESTWSVSGTTHTTGPNTCKAFIAQFTAARMAGTEIAGIYFDGDEVPGSCSNWAAFRSANVRYFVL